MNRPRVLLSFLGIVGWILMLPIVALGSVWSGLRRMWQGRDVPPRSYGTWQSDNGDQFTRPARIEMPRTVEDVVHIVATRGSHRVRAIGSGHSFSPVALTDGILLDVTQLRLPGGAQVEPIDRRDVREGSPLRDEILYRVASGTTIRRLNCLLAKRGLAIINLGSYDAQTIAGAISTGTHGSGIAFGPIAEQVVSLDLVCERADHTARRVRIEPADGPSDPRRAPNGVELVQDDATFRAAVVSFGSFGVVTSYVMRLAKAFFLDERRESKPWSVVRAELEGRAFERHDHYDVYINPYARRVARGDHPADGRRCLVTTRRRLAEADPHGKDDRRRSPQTVLQSLPVVRFAAQWSVTMFTGVRRWLLDLGLESLVDARYVAPSHKVFHLGDVNKVNAYASELGLAVDTFTEVDGKPTPTYIAAVEAIFDIAEEQARRGRHFTSPISLRFTAASEQLLAMQHGRRTCMIELPLLVGTPGGHGLLKIVEERLHRLGSRPHWGQVYLHPTSDRVRALYGDSLDTWLARCLEYNHGAFDGLMTEALGLDGERRRRRPQREGGGKSGAEGGGGSA